MPPLSNGRVRHSVAFTLQHDEGSAEEADFLDEIARLEAIPGVEAFELMREVSPKNNFRFGLTMEFADPAAYGAYNEHPDHVAIRVGTMGFRGRRLPRDRCDSALTGFGCALRHLGNYVEPDTVPSVRTTCRLLCRPGCGGVMSGFKC